MPSRRCSECGKSLTGMSPQAKTCCEAHKKQRQRRLANARKKKPVPQHLETLHDAVVAKQSDIVHEVMKEELAPIVREAVTEEVLRALNDLVGLTPELVEAIKKDLRSGDDTVRGRAMTLLARYTLGNQSIAPQPDAPSGQQLVVNFELPRPGMPPPAVTASADVLRTCRECEKSKPETEFLEHSDRCRDCDERLRAEVAARFGA